MVHRCDPGVVNKDMEALLGLPDLRKHLLHCGFISNVQAVMPVIGKFSFKRRTAAPNYLATFAGVMLDEGAANPFTRTGNQNDFVLRHFAPRRSALQYSSQVTGLFEMDSLSSIAPVRQPTSGSRSSCPQPPVR